MPGLALVAAATAAGWSINWLVPTASPLVVGVVLGIVWRARFGVAPALGPGLRFCSTWLLRTGVMLLGLQLIVGSVVQFGLPVLLVVVTGAAGSFGLTLWLGRIWRLGAARSLLLATGVSICGASAVAAANAVADGDEDDVATAVTAVTLLGTAAIVIVPVLGVVLGLDDTELGIWTGASVHEVGQVVAIGGAAGAAVLQAAVVVKLTRVALLAPLVVAIGLVRRRGRSFSRPPVLPWFVAGFLVLAALRMSGCVPAAVVSTSEVAATLLLCAGMFGLGAAVDLRAVVRSGGSALTVAAVGSIALATLAATGLRLVY